MRTSPPQKRDRCKYCGLDFPAWLPVAQAPDGPMLVHHLSLIHPAEVGPSLARMRTEDIAMAARAGVSANHVHGCGRLMALGHI